MYMKPQFESFLDSCMTQAPSECKDNVLLV